MADTSKFNLQKIINDVKSLINSAPVPEANKDDPLSYFLNEIGKNLQALNELQNQQTNLLTKTMETVGNLANTLKQKNLAKTNNKEETPKQDNQNQTVDNHAPPKDEQTTTK